MTVHKSTISTINENGTQTRHTFTKAWRNSAIFKRAELHPSGRIRSAEMFNGVSPSGKAIMRIHKKFLAKFLNLPPADRHTTTQEEGKTGWRLLQNILMQIYPVEWMLGAENIEMHSAGISFGTRKAAIASRLYGKDLKLFNRFESGIISRFTAL